METSIDPLWFTIAVGGLLLVLALLLYLMACVNKQGFPLVQVDMSNVQMTGIDMVDFMRYAVEFFKTDPEMKRHTGSLHEITDYLYGSMYPRLTASFSIQTGRSLQILNPHKFIEDLIVALKSAGVWTVHADDSRL